MNVCHVTPRKMGFPFNTEAWDAGDPGMLRVRKLEAPQGGSEQGASPPDNPHALV